MLQRLHRWFAAVVLAAMLGMPVALAQPAAPPQPQPPQPASPQTEKPARASSPLPYTVLLLESLLVLLLVCMPSRKV